MFSVHVNEVDEVGIVSMATVATGDDEWSLLISSRGGDNESADGDDVVDDGTNDVIMVVT